MKVKTNLTWNLLLISKKQKIENAVKWSKQTKKLTLSSDFQDLNKKSSLNTDAFPEHLGPSRFSNPIEFYRLFLTTVFIDFISE